MSAASEILLVDDTPENLRVLGDLLRAHGHTVRVASSGAMALRSVEMRRPDLILLDIRMPEMDGFEVCRRLRASPGRLGVPILFLSASDAPNDRVQAFQVGGEDFISKPFQTDEVLARVTTHLALARTRRELDLANERLAGEVVSEGRLRSAAESTAVERGVRLELTLAAANMGAWEVAPEGGAVLFDARARQILGLRPGERPHWRDFLRSIPEAAAGGATQRWERSRTRQEIFDIEGCWTTAAGGPGQPATRRIRLRGRPLPPQGDAPSRMAGVIWDVSEEYLLRERLNQAERLESLGLLAGGVAHDFNNQLSVILGELELLHLEQAVDASAAPHLRNIEAAAESSAALVRDLLTYARSREVAHAAIDLCEVVRQASRLAARPLGTGIRLETAVPATPLWISGNSGQLENAILNLAINARDAMPDGGTLRIALEERTVAGASCLVSAGAFTGTFAVITVADSGTGIPDAIRDRIFEPFFTTKPLGKGTGLGLAAVLGCVASHGGHLTLDTGPGRGTRFGIHLPPIPAPASAVPSAIAAVGEARRTGRIMLLDDQESVREVIAGGLRHLGWEVESFGEPAAAITAWAEASPPFAVALVDMVMPGSSGAKVFREIRRGDGRAKVVLMSGHAAGESIDALRQEGLAGFVDKPVKLRQLAQALAKLLDTEMT